MQGLGYVTTEQMLRSRETGESLSLGPGNYKVGWNNGLLILKEPFGMSTF